MMRKDVVIVNRLGLHARAAAKLVTKAGAYACTVHLERNGHRVNGKSIMGVMLLAASRGTTVTLETLGDDEAAAMADLEALIADRFGEPE